MTDNNISSGSNISASKNLAIVNRGQKFGMLFGVITKNDEIHRVIFKAIKEKRARKIVDNENTLAYRIS